MKPWECYDCGSTLQGRHTAKCELAPPGDRKDLPAIGASQWWTASRAAKYFDTSGTGKLPFNELMRWLVNGQTQLPGVGALDERLN